MQSDNEESVLPLILLLIRLFLPTFSDPRRLSIPAPLAAAAGLIAFLSFFSLETIFFLNFHRNWFPFTDFSKKKIRFGKLRFCKCPREVVDVSSYS